MSPNLFLSAILLTNSLLSFGQRLVLYDEFDSSSLNKKTWKTQQDFGPHINADKDKQIFTPQNVLLADNKLKLFLKEEPGCYDTWRFCDSSNCDKGCVQTFIDPACSSPVRCEIQGGHCLCLVPKHFKYTAGMIVSTEKFCYGIFEIRCKIPADCETAFWLYGDCCSEIDIFEFLGCEEDNASITIHQCPEKNCSNNLQCGESLKTLKSSVRPDFSAGFHTWKLDWKPEGLAVYVDGKLVYQCNANGLGACLYNTFNLSGGDCTIGTHTLYPRGAMNLVVDIATNPNDCLAPTPSALEIDYIKVWQY